jgi:hypothetical protein
MAASAAARGKYQCTEQIDEESRTQYFLQSARIGHSSGSAVLEAVRKLVNSSGVDENFH